MLAKGGNVESVVAASRTKLDGYSLMPTSQVTVINPHLYQPVPYDPDKDFVPITRVATPPNVLVVDPSAPALTVKEFPVELIRREPGAYPGYAQPGIGTPSHLDRRTVRLSLKLDPAFDRLAAALAFDPVGDGGPSRRSRSHRCRRPRRISNPAA